MDKSEKIIDKIKEEKIVWRGPINFASNCREGNMVDAFEYGLKIGIEITKEDCIEIVKNELESRDN